MGRHCLPRSLCRRRGESTQHLGRYWGIHPNTGGSSVVLPDRKFFADPESVTFLAPPGPTSCLVLVLLPLAFSVAGEHFVSTLVAFVVVVVVVFHSFPVLSCDTWRSGAIGCISNKFARRLDTYQAHGCRHSAGT